VYGVTSENELGPHFSLDQTRGFVGWSSNFYKIPFLLEYAYKMLAVRMCCALYTLHYNERDPSIENYLNSLLSY